MKKFQEMYESIMSEAVMDAKTYRANVEEALKSIGHKKLDYTSEESLLKAITKDVTKAKMQKYGKSDFADFEDQGVKLEFNGFFIMKTDEDDSFYVYFLSDKKALKDWLGANPADNMFTFKAKNGYIVRIAI